MSEKELLAMLVGTVVPILVGAVVHSWQKRQDEQRKNTGERIGRLERFVDEERGRQRGLREARRIKRGRDVES